MAQQESSRKRIIIAIDLDYFFAQCEEIRKPELKEKPLVICVYSGRTETSGAVSTANYLARKLGVRSGIPIANAKRILAKRSDAIFLPVDHEYYESVSERVMEIVKSQSPSSLFEQASIDEAYQDITEYSNGSYDRALRLGQGIKDEIKSKERLSSTLGIGPNKLIAKMAADSKKPDGLVAIKEAEVKRFLEDLPVSKLMGIGPKTETKMATLGISRIGELSRFDPEILSETFGKNLGPIFRRLAQGIDDEPVRERPSEQLSRMITLKQDVNFFSFEDDLVSIAQDLCRRLVSLKLKYSTVGIIAITSELKPKSRAKTLDKPTDSCEVILKESRELFQDLFRSLEKDQKVRRAGIRVSGLKLNSEGETKEMESQDTLTSFFPSS